VRGRVLVATHFDSASASTGVEFMPVAQSVGSDAGTGNRVAVSVSTAGVLAYRGGDASAGRQLIWTDRTGKTLETLWPADDAGLGAPMLARDGRHVAVSRIVQGSADLWVIDVARKSIGRFTFDGADEGSATWSPDGSKIIFRSNRNGRYDLFEKPANGSADEQPLLVTGQNKQSLDWSPDGRFFLYTTEDPKTRADIWALPLQGDRKPFPVVQTRFEETQGQFSPDGRWMAYASNETGRYEVYVTPFPDSRGKWQISTAGGVYPRWRSDGRELFYVSPENRLMAVSIQIAAPTAVTVAAPLALFQTRLTTGNLSIAGIAFASRPQYAVASDGRFLMNVDVEHSATPPITIVQNWTALLKR
jgi:dipeptidyl aminopeptidase/acylaminoacyl peptidase